MKEQNIIRPDWPVPANVRSLSTTRAGGVSQGPWYSLNLGEHCGDDDASVSANRERLRSQLPSEPIWLRQVHGTRVFVPGDNDADLPEADAAVTSNPEQVLAILTADCLPILLCDELGRRVGAAHAGWRGLCDGVIEATVKAMQVSPERLIAWLGPAIGQDAYEVGEDVFESFSRRSGSSLVDAMMPVGEKWKLDLAGAARTVLTELGVTRVFGGGFCTHRDPARFFSYRRDHVTGRMASLVWLEG